MTDSFSTHDTLEVNGERYRIASLAKLGKRFNLGRLPYSMKILLENLLRHEDGLNVTAKEIEAVANWDAKTESEIEIAFIRHASCCRISPAFHASSTLRRCATRSSSSAAIPN